MDPINGDEKCSYHQNEDENEPVSCVREEKRRLRICNPDKANEDATDSLLEATGGKSLSSNHEYMHGTSSREVGNKANEGEEYVNAVNNPKMEEDLETAEDTLVSQLELPSSTKPENSEPDTSRANEHFAFALSVHKPRRIS